MAKRGRPVTNPRTDQRELMENPPPYIAKRIAVRRTWGIDPLEEILKDMDRYNEIFERRRKQLQITTSQLEVICDRCLVDPSDKDLLRALSAVMESKIRITATAIKGGKAKSEESKPKWHSEATRLEGEILENRTAVDTKLTVSRLAEHVLRRWNHPTLKAPSHRSIRAYLAKSI